MGFPNISKLEGLLLSPVCIGVYWSVYYGFNMYWFGSVPGFDTWGTRIFTVGAVLHMMIYLNEGGQLTFGTKRLDTFWSDGLCFAPNILHFTVEAFGFALLWGVKVDTAENYNDRGRVDILVHPLLATTRHNVQMSHLAATIDRGITAFFLWLFFGWKSGQAHLTLMRFGFRLMLVGYILATMGGGWGYGVKQTSSAVNHVVSTVNSMTQNGTPEQSERYSSQLTLGVPPGTPAREYFNPTHEKDTRYFMEIAGDSRKYFVYRELSPNKDDYLTERDTEVNMHESLCMLVPPGRRIFFDAKRSPAFTVDMAPDMVYFGKKYGFTLGWLFDDFLLEVRSMKLVDIPSKWHEAETERHPILLRALASGEIPGSSRGIVCF